MAAGSTALLAAALRAARHHAQVQQQTLFSGAPRALPPLITVLQQHTHQQWRGLAARPAKHEEERVSYFQKQRARQQEALQELQQKQAVTGDSNALVTLKPNEGPASLQQVANVVRHPALIVTRPVEWGTVIFGYEQANRYTVYDQEGQPVAQLMEDYTGIGNELGRQLLRTRRSFTATVFSADGSQVIFKLKRPMYLINSTMYVEDGLGKVVGEIRQKWHPLRRNYNLYLDKRQFASISGTFLAWEFELKDEKGGTLALIDRNFQGFGKELFTDAGKYVIHFGAEATSAAGAAHLDQQPQQPHLDREAGQPVPPLPPPGVAPASIPLYQPQQPQQQEGGGAGVPGGEQGTGSSVAVMPTVTGNQLAVQRALALDERMITLACAITIDFDFFSQHSNSGGWLRPPLIFFPGGGSEASTTHEGGPGAPAPGAGGAAGAAGGMAGPATAGAAGEMAAGGGGAFAGGGAAASSSGADGEVHMGGDEFQAPPSGGDGEMRWDLPSDSGSASGGDGEGGGGGLLGALWNMFTGGDD